MFVVAILAQAILLTGQFALAAAASAAQHHARHFPALPISVLDSTNVWAPTVGGGYTVARYALAIAQSLVAIAIARSPKLRGGSRSVAAASALGFVIAFCAPVLTSADVYAYIAYGIFATSAYAPAGPLPPSFAAIGDWWSPLPPSVYGALWTAVSTLLVSVGHTPFGAVLAFRALGAAALLLLVRFARGESWTAALMVATSPVLLWLGVGDAHNDLLAVDAALLAAALARRRPLLAALAIAGAILVKATVLLPAVLAVRAVRGLRLQFVTAAGGIAVAAIVTWIAGGAAYIRALRADALTHHTLYGGLHFALFALAIVLTVLAVRGRMFPGGEWAYPWAAAWLYPWYLHWALPYALLRRGAIVQFLCALPLAAVALDTTYQAPFAARSAAVIGALFVLRIRLRDGSPLDAH